MNSRWISYLGLFIVGALVLIMLTSFMPTQATVQESMKGPSDQHVIHILKEFAAEIAAAPTSHAEGSMRNASVPETHVHGCNLTR